MDLHQHSFQAFTALFTTAIRFWVRACIFGSGRVRVSPSPTIYNSELNIKKQLLNQ